MEEQLITRKKELEMSMDIRGWKFGIINDEKLSKEDSHKLYNLRVEYCAIAKKLEQIQKKRLEEDRLFEEEVNRRLAKELFERRVDAEVRRRLAAMEKETSQYEDTINEATDLSDFSQ